MFWLRTLLLRRLGPVGLALTAYDIWRRVPKARRRRIRARARRYGTHVAGNAAAVAAKLARSRRLDRLAGRRGRNGPMLDDAEGQLDVEPS